jgi:hypothetical protein
VLGVFLCQHQHACQSKIGNILTRCQHVTNMRVKWDEEGNDFGGKSNGNEGGRQAMATRAMATVMATMWAMATATSVVGNKEGKGDGCKSNSGATRMVGKRQQQGKWQQQRQLHGQWQ